MDMTPAGSNLIRKEIHFFILTPGGVTQPFGNKRRCSTTMCNPAGVGILLYIRFANEVESLWDSGIKKMKIEK